MINCLHRNIVLLVAGLALINVSDAFQTFRAPLRLNQRIGASSIFPTTRFEHNDVILHGSNNKNEDHRGLKWDRVFDTMKTAGFKDYSVQMAPKKFLIIFVSMMAFKFVRSRMLKQNFMEKQPAWGHVITSKDQEKNLHAWTCKKCGSTMFIAKGREIRFFNPIVGIECQNCGAKGKESFYDRREEIAAEDDTDFQYENPLDYISNQERKKMMKEMELEKKTEDDAAVVVSATSVTEEQGDSSSSSTNNSENPSEGSDGKDPLGMDL